MKQTLIWFNLQRDGTRNGLSNIKETFGESLQLEISVLHQRMRFLLRLANTFPIDTDKYIITQCVTKCVTNDTKTFKNPVYYFTVYLLIIIYITGSFNWDL